MRFDVPTLSFGTTSDAPFIGVNASSPQYRDLCPAGQVVTGIQLEGQWRSFAVECGTPLFDLPLRVAVTPGRPLAHHGALAPRFALSCPWNTALTQFEMFTGSSFIAVLTMSCAPFTGANTTQPWTVSVDPTMQAARLGSAAATPNQATTCPAGQVAVGVQSSMTPQSNSYVTLTDLGVVCAAPQVP